MARVTESGLRWSGPGVELRLLSAVARYAAGDLDGSLRATHAPESPPPDVAAARLAAVSCYAAVAGGLPDAAPRLAALRESWDVHPQVGAGRRRLRERPPDVGGGAGATRWRRQSVPRPTWTPSSARGCTADSGSRRSDWEPWPTRRRTPATSATTRGCPPPGARVTSCCSGSTGSSRAGSGRPGDLGPEGRAWHARAVAEHARLQGGPIGVDAWRYPSRCAGLRVQGTSTSRRGVALASPTPWSPPVIATAPGSTPSKPRRWPGRRCRRPRCSGAVAASTSRAQADRAHDHRRRRADRAGAGGPRAGGGGHDEP